MRQATLNNHIIIEFDLLFIFTLTVRLCRENVNSIMSPFPVV